MGSFMDGLEAEAYDRSYKDRELVSRIIGYFQPQRKVMVFVAVLIIINALLNVAYPIFISSALEYLHVFNVFKIAALLIASILAISIFSWVSNLFRQWFTAKAVGNVVLKLRTDAFSSVMHHDMSFFDKFSSGKIISRITSDTSNFAKVVTLVLDLLSQVLLFLLIAVVLFFINWRLAFLTCTILPAVIIVTLGFRILARQATRKAQRSMANVNANVQEIISGITVAKNFRQEARTYQEFQCINEQLYHINVRSNFLYCCVFPLFGAIAGIGTVIVVYFGGAQVLNHSLSFAAWFLFVQSIGLLWNPLTNISSFWSQFQQGLSASERVFALLDTESHLHQTDQQTVPHLLGKIEFDNVSFRYDGRQAVLTNFNLTISAGETVAFVGHTGAGKTSIAKLIARFYEFQEGRLLIDGHDIRSFNLHDYQKHIGIVPQLPFLFSGTVADNIRYAKLSATDEEVIEIVNRIGGGNWMKLFPNGLKTLVGEGGKKLSLGQRQLVSLARILLQDPAIFILDEATASIDPLTETYIQEGLDVALKNRTAILIAHRLSTIKHASRIIVLSQGQIVEMGDHKSLIHQGGYYAQLYNMYFRHQSSQYQPGQGFVPVLIGGVYQKGNDECD